MTSGAFIGEGHVVLALRIVVIVLALLIGGWLLFDGVHALRTGDYVTPRSGERAGQLGPWKHVVSAAGIEPRSTLMKWIHVLIGVVWLAAIVCFALKLSWAWWAMLVMAVAGAWYLPFGTLLGIVQIVLLLVMRARGG